MQIKNEPIIIRNSAAHIYNFLNDFNNFESLMPDQISNWKSDKNSCSFEINNMATIELRITDRQEDKSIRIDSEGKKSFSISARFQFGIHWRNGNQI